MENNDKKKRSFWEIIMYVYIIGLIVTVLLRPIPNRRHYSARGKACYSNIRVIQGAVEMYNMDHEDMILTLNDAETRNPTILEGYLKPVSHPETMCSYLGSGLGDGDGGVWCTYHGDVDGSLGIKGFYQIPSRFSIAVNKFMDDCECQFPFALAWPILWSFIIYMTFFSR